MAVCIYMYSNLYIMNAMHWTSVNIEGLLFYIDVAEFKCFFSCWLKVILLLSIFAFCKAVLVVCDLL